MRSSIFNHLVLCLSFLVWSDLNSVGTSQEVDRSHLQKALKFYAPFDGDPDARKFQFDGKIRTGESLARKSSTLGIGRTGVTIAKGAGRFGDCLRFQDKAKEVLYFSGKEIPYQAHQWSGTVSFWMRLSPDTDLKPGYCDPIQITQLAWNNSAFFVDFDKDLPRDFRLGVFSELTHWNPENTPWEKIPFERRPMVTVKKPPFSKEKWTHVLYTFSNANSDREGSAALYLDGEQRGVLRQSMRFPWDLEKTAIMLGIEYIGDMDELLLFDRDLTPLEVRFLFQLQEPL